MSWQIDEDRAEPSYGKNLSMNLEHLSARNCSVHPEQGDLIVWADDVGIDNVGIRIKVDGRLLHETLRAKHSRNYASILLDKLLGIVFEDNGVLVAATAETLLAQLAQPVLKFVLVR